MRKFFFLLLLCLLALPASAQDFTVDQNIRLIPFMVESLDIQGVRPATWRQQSATAPGVFLRFRDQVDLTAIIMQARAGSAADFLSEVSSQFALTSTPEVLETIETEFFSWSLYRVERVQSRQNLVVDMAVAEFEGRTYYILMQTAPVFYEQLHTEIFLPAVQWLSPLRRYQDPEARFDVPIPAMWALEETETYGILRDESNTMTIYLDAVEGDDAPAALQAFWETIYPDFELGYNPETGINIIEDPARIGNLEAVYIINWRTGEEETGLIKQGVARVYDGMIYMSLIETTVDSARLHDAALTIVDNNYRILALLPESTAEATQDA